MWVGLLFEFGLYFGACLGVGYMFFSTCSPWAYVEQTAVWMWQYIASVFPSTTLKEQPENGHPRPKWVVFDLLLSERSAFFVCVLIFVAPGFALRAGFLNGELVYV